MKVLVLTITAGEGHNSTANAIKDEFIQRGDICETLDGYRYFSRALYKAVANGYLLVTKNAKFAFRAGYSLAERRHGGSDKASMARLMNTVISTKIKKYIEDYKPDVIVYTHVFLGVVLDVLKKSGKILMPTIGVVTDFTVHPYWEDARYSDYIVTANELLETQMLKKGFRKEQIMPLGIPINPKFSKKISKKEARVKLGLEPDKTTILVMGGSMGYGHIADTIEGVANLPGDFQIISVCGNNLSAKREIDALESTRKILNFGFTRNVDLLMDASDCIVTKPGGLTSSEALTKNLPIIICHPIPGQEQRNSDFLMNAGVALMTNSHTTLDEVMRQLFQNPLRLTQMKEAIEVIKKPNAVSDLCELAHRAADEYKEAGSQVKVKVK